MPQSLNKTVKGAKSAKTVKAKTARRVIKPWTKEDVRTLKAHSKARTPVPKVSKVMKRTVGALRRRGMTAVCDLARRHDANRTSRREADVAEAANSGSASELPPRVGSAGHDVRKPTAVPTSSPKNREKQTTSAAWIAACPANGDHRPPWSGVDGLREIAKALAGILKPKRRHRETRSRSTGYLFRANSGHSSMAPRKGPIGLGA